MERSNPYLTKSGGAFLMRTLNSHKLSPSLLEKRRQAALRLRERCLSIPFYAEKDRRLGMDYWLALQGSAVLNLR